MLPFSISISRSWRHFDVLKLNLKSAQMHLDSGTKNPDALMWRRLLFYRQSNLLLGTAGVFCLRLNLFCFQKRWPINIPDIQIVSHIKSPVDTTNEGTKPLTISPTALADFQERVVHLAWRSPQTHSSHTFCVLGRLDIQPRGSFT